MIGMNRGSGKSISGVSHIVQSIGDILSTPVGTRVELLEYGSNLPKLVDRPMNSLLTVELYAETAKALARWEPRFKLTSVWVGDRSSDGRITLGLSGVIKSDGVVVRIEGIKL